MSIISNPPTYIETKVNYRDIHLTAPKLLNLTRYILYYMRDDRDGTVVMEPSQHCTIIRRICLPIYYAVAIGIGVRRPRGHVSFEHFLTVFGQKNKTIIIIL